MCPRRKRYQRPITKMVRGVSTPAPGHAIPYRPRVGEDRLAPIAGAVDDKAPSQGNLVRGPSPEFGYDPRGSTDGCTECRAEIQSS